MIDYSTLPNAPGCYLFRDSGGKILYIGKAKRLKKRVDSYFHKKDLDEKTKSLVSQIASVDTIITKTEKEALILENNLIKKYWPKYNINLKDSRRYAYLLLTKEKFPRLLLTRDNKKEGSYFGPFVSAEKRDYILRFATNVFRIRTCKKLPKRECLRYHMGLCDAPCTGKISETRYISQIADAREFLSGKSPELLKKLRQEMAERSKLLEYETAKSIRDTINAIESLNERQNVETIKKYDQDAVNYVRTGDEAHIAVFNIGKGVLGGKAEFTVPWQENLLEEFITRYYSEESIPNEILLPEKISPAIAQYLSEIKNQKVRIISPEKGAKKDLLNLVRLNLEKEFMEDELSLLDLKEKLNLPALPKIIECFDISHLSGSDSVGSMVRFSDGTPDKQNYRRFRIKTIEGIDDFSMIAEIVRRRYSRLAEEKKEMPDLIVIDGGKGQLSSAVSELARLGLKLPVISLAKKEEEVYFPGIAVPKRYERKSRALRLLQRLRDEAHRFAVSYHKILRGKRIRQGTK